MDGWMGIKKQEEIRKLTDFSGGMGRPSKIPRPLPKFITS